MFILWQCINDVQHVCVCVCIESVRQKKTNITSKFTSKLSYYYYCRGLIIDISVCLHIYIYAYPYLYMYICI